MSIKHRFQSAIADAGDPNELGPDEWNDTHSQKCGNTLLASGVKAITFAGAGFSDEPDAAYVVVLTPTADEVLRVDWPLLTTGFTVRSSDGGSANRFLWAIARA